MRKALYAAALTVAVFAAAGQAQMQGRGWMSRYWDGCMPSCSWAENVAKQENAPYGISKACDINNEEKEIPNRPPDGFAGITHTCWSQIPFVSPDDTLVGYGFAATPGHTCGICFELTFTGGAASHTDVRGPHTALAASGKKLIVMGSNIGEDVGTGQFDFMAPGGGLGQFNCFTQQLDGISPSDLGNNDGGFARDCDNEIGSGSNYHPDTMAKAELFRECAMNKCNAVFGKNPAHADLLTGCLFYADFLMAVNNPEVDYKEVPCPQALIDKYVTRNYVDESGEREPDTVIVEIGEVVSGKKYFNVTINGIGSTYKTIILDYNANPWSVTFNVRVNDEYVGNISHSVSSNNENHVATLPLSEFAQFMRGDNNVIEIEVQSDPFTLNSIVIIGEKLVGGDDPIVAIRQNCAGRNRPAAAPRALVRPIAGGLTATLPANHGYTSYSLTDMRGRVIKRGRIGANAADLRISGVNAGVVFLRLEGAGKPPAILRTTIVR